MCGIFAYLRQVGKAHGTGVFVPIGQDIMVDPLTNKPKLFLSYARTDDDGLTDDSFVKRLHKDLTERGCSVWWDRDSMPNRGSTFLNAIRDAITAVDRVILIIGPGAIQSDYVRAEWEYALSICISVLPILRKGDYGLLPDALKNIDT